MANEEQLKILKQGVDVWNQWRKDNPDKTINLTGANLDGADLRRAELRNANLCVGNLHRADLRQVDLRNATLDRADLRRADLGQADLRDATLTGADLRRADLRDATLDGADLRQADLDNANLIRTRLRNTKMTGAYLYGTARDDWIIDGIVCDYIYWDNKPRVENAEEEQQWDQEHRTPKDRDFRPGEFEELYKSLPTFEYYFEHGFTPIDAVVMDQVVQTINQQNPEYEVKLTTLDSRGQPHAVFTVIRKEYAAPAQQQITTDYERRIAALEGKQEQLMQIVSTLVNQPQYIGELIMGDKRMILAGHNYHERINGNVQITTGTSNSEESSAEQKPGIPGRSSES